MIQFAAPGSSSARPARSRAKPVTVSEVTNAVVPPAPTNNRATGSVRTSPTATSTAVSTLARPAEWLPSVLVRRPARLDLKIN